MQIIHNNTPPEASEPAPVPADPYAVAADRNAGRILQRVVQPGMTVVDYEAPEDDPNASSDPA